MKKVIFEGNGLTLTEKMNKKGVSLIFKMDGVKLDLNVVANDNIKLIIDDVETGVFGYSNDELTDKNLSFVDFKTKRKEGKVSLFIPYLEGERPKKVSAGMLIETITAVILSYDKNDVDRLEESMNELQRMKNNIRKYGIE